MHANDRKDIDRAQAGDIFACVGMKNVKLGHTLCSTEVPCTIEGVVCPEPILSIAVAPKDKAHK